MLAKKGLMTAPAAVAQYVEDVFSTYLYTGTGTNVNRTITNGVDLSGEGGLVWTKVRDATYINALNDTARGLSNYLVSENTGAENQYGSLITMTANSDGYTMNDQNGSWNENNKKFVSWTFRKAEKFFDVVTYTGNGTAGRTISHNLGSVPGCIIVKRTDSADNWTVYHRSLGATTTIFLNGTAAQQGANSAWWNNTTPTSTVFTVGNDDSVNGNGATYVAYLFAHDAGGFGDDGSDNVITCGSYTGNGSTTGPTVTLGYEPQWVMIKRGISASTGNWFIFDNMRGLTVDQEPYLYANTADAEFSPSDFLDPTATGFNIKTSAGSVNASGDTYIYIAIRRGPMKTPESGTEVFQPVVSTSANDVLSTLDRCDMGIFKDAATSSNIFVSDRLRGITGVYNKTLYTNLTNAEATPSSGDTISADPSTGAGNGKLYFGGAGLNTNKPTGYAFRRAPGFFDMVCWTGNATSGRQISHNLGVTPELMFISTRNNSGGFNIYHQALGATKMMQLSTDGTPLTESWLNNTSPSSTYFTVAGGVNETNASGYTYIAYLFATVTGISKVGSVSYSGSAVNVDCGFTSGARFVLIKRSNDTGAWGLFDSARGIVDGNDPYLYLNSTAAENSDGTEDCIDTYSSGFTITTGFANVFGTGTFIYLAIA